VRPEIRLYRAEPNAQLLREELFQAVDANNGLVSVILSEDE